MDLPVLLTRNVLHHTWDVRDNRGHNLVALDWLRIIGVITNTLMDPASETVFPDTTPLPPLFNLPACDFDTTLTMKT